MPSSSGPNNPIRKLDPLSFEKSETAGPKTLRHSPLDLNSWQRCLENIRVDRVRFCYTNQSVNAVQGNIAVCSEIHIKYINTPCGQNVELLNVKLAVHTVTTGLIIGKFTLAIP